VDGGETTYLTNDVKPGASMATKVRAGRDRTVGHDWGGNVGLDEHTVRQRGVGGLVLFGGQGVQDGGVDPQRDQGSSGGGRWGGSRSDTSGGVGILVTFGGYASEERASRSIVGIAVGTRRAVTILGLGRGSALSLPTSWDFGMDEATPFAVRAGPGDPKSLSDNQEAVSNQASIRRTLQISVLYLGCRGTFRSSSSP
jgi:hypothetical protein